MIIIKFSSILTKNSENYYCVVNFILCVLFKFLEAGRPIRPFSLGLHTDFIVLPVVLILFPLYHHPIASFLLLPGTGSHLWFAGVRECPPWCSIVGATVTVHQFFCILHFCHACSLCRVELVVQFPASGSTQVLLCLLPGVLWLRHFLFSVGPHPVSSLHVYTFFVSRAFMAGAASQAGDADSSRAPFLYSGLKGSVNVHRGALLFVPQWQCISSFVFYIYLAINKL